MVPTRPKGFAAGRALMVLGFLAFLAMFLVWPLWHVFQESMNDEDGFTLRYLAGLFENPQQLEAIARSALIAVLTTAGCFVVALPTSWLFARRSFPGKAVLNGALLLPLILPPFVGAVGMKILFARAGAVTTLLNNLGLVEGTVDWFGTYPLFGIVLMEVLHLFPILHLNLVAALANVDPSLEDAARNMGASPWRVFKRVTMPLASPGMFAGAVLVFIWSFTELGTPLVFGVRQVLPVMIFDGVSEIGTNPMGYAQVVFVLVITVLGFWLSKRLLRSGKSTATLGRMSVAAVEKPVSIVGLPFVYLGLAALVLVAVLPHISTILLGSSRLWFQTVVPEGFTGEFFGRALGSPLTRTALFNSLVLSLCATGIDLVLGFGIAWLCVRGRIRGGDWLDSLSMLPLAVPGLVIAFGYMGCFSSAFPDSFLDPRHNPMALLAVSYGIRRLPYMVRAAHAGLEQVSPVYEEAALNLGASPLRVVWRITLPLISANLLAGGILCFAFSMLEVSDSLILAQSEEFYPITKAIYVLLSGLNNGPNVAAALGTWAMALLGSALLCAAALLGKRMGQMFRAG